jgi:HAD superfamily phosphoserine phosphatase-like hydrolase
MKIAIFDVCGTLYESNTTFDFLEFFFEKNNKFAFFILKMRRRGVGLFLLKLLYKVSKHDFYRAYVVSRLAGYRLEDVNEQSVRFVNDVLPAKENKAITKMLRDFKNRGYYIVLASGSLFCVVAEIAKTVGADDFFGSRLEVRNDLLTGLYIEDILHNKKDVLLRRYNDYTEIIVVTDNKTDFELLNFATKGYVICNSKKICKYWKSVRLDNIELVML